MVSELDCEIGLFTGTWIPTNGIRVSDCEFGLLMGKWILLGVGPVKILFLIGNQSAKVLRSLVSIGPRNQGLAEVQNTI